MIPSKVFAIDEGNGSFGCEAELSGSGANKKVKIIKCLGLPIAE